MKRKQDDSLLPYFHHQLWKKVNYKMTDKIYECFYPLQIRKNRSKEGPKHLDYKNFIISDHIYSILHSRTKKTKQTIPILGRFWFCVQCKMSIFEVNVQSCSAENHFTFGACLLVLSAFLVSCLGLFFSL